ncbi:MAG: PAS domain S-box protein [Thermodesulfobacteriota bacterium]
MATILLLISDQTLRERVSGWLREAGHQAPEAAGLADLPQDCDLILGDGAGWAWAGPSLLDRRAAAHPGSLPLALIQTDSPAPAGAARPEGVDDILPAEAGREVLLARVDRLLGLRRLAQEFERRYNAMAEAMPAGVLLLRETRIANANTRFFALTGLAPGREQGLELPELFHPGDRKKLLRCLAGLAQAPPRPAIIETRLSPALGEHWVELRLTRLDDADPGWMLGILQDIQRRRQAQESLKRSERRYRRLLDGMLEGCQIIAPDLTYVYVNQAAAGQGRRQAKDLVGRKLTEVYPNLERDNPLLMAKIRQCLEQGATERFANEFVYPDGSRGWFELSLRPVPEGVFILSMDITAREKARRELQESERKYRTLFNSMAQGGVYQDREGAIIDANPAAEVILGLTLDQMRGRTSLDPRWRSIREDGSEYPGYEHPSMLALMSGETVKDRVMGVYNPRDNATRWIKVTAVPQYDQDGQAPARVFTTFEDITELKLIEKSLRASEQKFRTLFNSAGDAIFILDASGRFIEVNEVACQRLGYSRQELLGMTPRDIDTPEAAALVEERVRMVLAKGEATFESSQMAKDGRVMPVEINARLIDLEGQPALLSMARDISERKATHLALARAQKMEAIGQLAAGIAHEINTPTQYIYTNVEFLAQAFQDLLGAVHRMEKALDEAAPGEGVDALRAAWGGERMEIGFDDLEADVSEAMAACLEGLGRVKAIVESMRYFSHPGSGEMKLVDVNRILANAVVVSKNAWKYHATLETDLQDGLPLTPAFESDLSQAVLNIIVNAAQALEEAYGGSQELRGRIVMRSRREEDWVTISIGDNGPGIPPDVRHAIFDPFFTTKEVGKGTGQGLAIAHSAIVDKHGGSLSFETEIGRGTTFFIRLPLKPAARPASIAKQG